MKKRKVINLGTHSAGDNDTYVTYGTTYKGKKYTLSTGSRVHPTQVSYGMAAEIFYKNYGGSIYEHSNGRFADTISNMSKTLKIKKIK